MKRLLLFFIISLAVSLPAQAQVGSGLGTKAVEALKACFNSDQEWTCGGGDLLTSDGTDVTLASGQLLLPDGLVGTPALSFFNDPNTGIYRFGDEQIGIAANGAISMRITNLLVQSYFPVRLPNGLVNGPALTWSSDTDSGLYRIGEDNIGMSIGGAPVMDWEDTNAAGAGADLTTVSSTLGGMDGSDTVRGLLIDLANANHTGAGNTLNLLDIDAITGDANADLNAINIGALTGTVGAAGELEYAIQVGGGWDAAFHDLGVAHAALQPADNGSFTFCTDCDPASTPCTAVGAQTGAFAFRVNGQWDCP